MCGKTTNLLFLGLSFGHHKFCSGYYNNFQDFIGMLEIFNHDCPHFVWAIMIENLLCAYEIPQIVVISLKNFMMPSDNPKISWAIDITSTRNAYNTGHIWLLYQITSLPIYITLFPYIIRLIWSQGAL